MHNTVSNACKAALGLLLLSSALAPGASAALAESAPAQAKANIVNAKGVTIGTAVLTQKGSSVLIHLEAGKLSPGVHAIHIHETGKCDKPSFKSAGSHLNPGGKQHGFNNPKGFHAGDLPNITVKEDGTVIADISTNQVTLAPNQPNSLRKKGGAALVIHEKADDYVTDPAGNSGDRVACGVIE